VPSVQQLQITTFDIYWQLVNNRSLLLPINNNKT